MCCGKGVGTLHPHKNAVGDRVNVLIAQNEAAFGNGGRFFILRISVGQSRRADFQGDGGRCSCSKKVLLRERLPPDHYWINVTENNDFLPRLYS
jgi:hypothetical protein